MFEDNKEQYEAPMLDELTSTLICYGADGDVEPGLSGEITDPAT